MEYSQRYSLNPAFKVERFDNEILLYAVSDTSGVYLNETACLVWEMCAQDQTVAEIISVLEAAYPEQAAAIAEDVAAAITSLVEYGALIVSCD